MTDLLCTNDLDPMAAEIDDPVDELEQDFYHRLIEPYGSNLDDPDRGVGLEDMLSGVVDNSLASRIDAEGKKDDRIDSVSTIVTQTGPETYQITIEIQPTGALLLEADVAAGTVRRIS